MKWEYIIIHHSDSDFLSRSLLHQWHVVENKWDDIGYHFFILNGYVKNSSLYDKTQDGIIELGRSIEIMGAHARGFNDKAIGICLAGLGGRFTFKQIISLMDKISELQKTYKIETRNILGHYEIEPKKPLCPSIDMIYFRELINKKGGQYGM